METSLTSTVLLQRITIIPIFTEVTVFTLCMIQALQAGPRLLVTGLWVSRIDVVITGALLAGSINLIGVSKEARSTCLTSASCLNKQTTRTGIIIAAC